MTEWPHLLADLKVKRDALDQVITILETTFSSDIAAADGVEVDVEDPVSRPLKRSKKRKPARRAAAPKGIKSVDKTNERTNEHEPRQRAARSLPDVDAIGDRIVAALRDRSPQKSGEIGALVKLTGGHLTRLLVKLSEAGRIQRSGTGRASSVSLPGRRPAKEGL